MLTTVFRKRATSRPVEFCDSCSEVCDTSCRASAAMERGRSKATTFVIPWIR